MNGPVRIFSLANANICSVCHTEVSDRGNLPAEYCGLCGSPVTTLCFDPLVNLQRVQVLKPMHSQSGNLLRFGVSSMGFFLLLCSASLLHAAFFQFAELDIFQKVLSVSGGPALALYGLLFLAKACKKKKIPEPQIAPVIDLNSYRRQK